MIIIIIIIIIIIKIALFNVDIQTIIFFLPSLSKVSHLLDVWSHELVKMQQQHQQQQQQQQQSNNSVSSVIIPPALPLALQTLINGGTTNTRHRSHHHSVDRTTGKVDDWAQVQEHIHTRVTQVVQRGRDLLNVELNSILLKKIIVCFFLSSIS